MKAVIEQLLAAGTAPGAWAEFFASLPNVSHEYEQVQGSDIYRLGFQAHICDPQYMLCSLPVAGNKQYYGLFNGGSTALLGESTASLAANLTAYEGTVAVGIEISVQHLEPARTGRVYCLAIRLNEGRIVRYSLHFYRSDGVLMAFGTHSVTFKPAEAAL